MGQEAGKRVDWSKLYEQLILRHPVAVIAVFAILVLGFGWFARDFGLDASADSLTLEHDQALAYYRSVRARYGSDDYLIVAFSPHEALFSRQVLAELAELRDSLAALPAVESVVSILDVPLVQSPSVSLRELPDGIRRLEDDGTDVGLARNEFLTSPLYRNYVVSPDGRTTALRVDFRQDQRYLDLRARRDELRERRFAGALSDAEALELDAAEAEFDRNSREQIERERRNIAEVRAVVDVFRDSATIYLGGVPMIVADSIDFIRYDLITFGVAVLIFLVLILGIAFHKARWIVLPLLTCLGTCIVMMGLLGLSDWSVTVVSSNFLSLLLILCLALTLHIIVRYREAHTLRPDARQMFLVKRTVQKIVVPCFYTALTTIVAFGSLIVSGIRPVIDFGWMMVIGIAIAFVFSFTFFPAGLMLVSPGEPRRRFDLTAAITAFFARIIERHSRATVIVSTVLVAASVAGIVRLTVENRFIDYYRKSTEIYQGMELIDRQLGGTTPLDVIIDPPRIAADDAGDDIEDGYADDLDDLYGDDAEYDAGITATSYWFNSQRLPQVESIHRYLDALPQTGKVISIATTAEVLRSIEPSVLEDNVELSIVYKNLPQDVLDALIDPYLSPDRDQLRFAIRVFESDPTLRRSKLLDQIRQDLGNRFAVGEEQLHMSGMLVLYNNMLESLFRSQILTLGAVFVAILAMFVVLFRSLRVALTAIIPNIASAALVLGIMGWLSIPLDLMTITIAAITVGIAVDDTIHYVHRFRHEFPRDGNPWATVKRCHRTIGRAMYYTSVTIMLGFSILALSQFVPTVYFGLLTGFAMLVALFANMTLLPVLLVIFHAR